MKGAMGLIALGLMSISLNAAAGGGAIGLGEALREAEAHSPGLRAGEFRQEAASQEIRAAQSGYLPSLDASAIASTGNLGAMALLGADNNISATNRVGEGAALILRQNLWDFGRTSGAVASARSQRELSNQELGFLRAQVDLQVLHTYFECAFLRSQIEDSMFTAQEARVVARETNKYVMSGQRSIVERYLVDAQAQEADTLTAELKARSQTVEERLAIELGRPPGQAVSCLDLGERKAEVLKLTESAGRSPLLDISEAQAQVAQHRLDQAKAEEMPYLIGVVNGGYFDNSQLRTPWNYAAGLGVTLPIFEGFRTQAEIGRLAAEAQGQQANVEFSRQKVDESNSRYDEQIRGTQVRLDFLKKENDLGESAYRLAKKRYFNLQGTMVDLREALRNLDRIRQSIDQARRDYLVSLGERALFNGARP